MSLPLFGLLSAVVLVDAALYLGWSARAAAGVGYPLDDSWIHQALARNVWRFGQWTINPGEPAAVTSAPLWTALLALGYLIPGVARPWTLALGAAGLLWAAWETWALASLLLPARGEKPGPALRAAAGRSWLPLAAALLVAVEWHLVWGAFSGMESVLFAAVSLSCLRGFLEPGPRRPARLGPLLGLLPLLRPEGALLAPLGAAWLLAKQGRTALRQLLPVAAAALPIFAVCYAANVALGGGILPATLYAKNAAYGAPAGLGDRLAFLTGAAVELGRGPLLLLYPGLLWLLLNACRRRPHASGLAPWFSQPHALAILWATFLLLAYAAWLPVVYHHGRYLFPLIPLAAIYGLAGGAALLGRFPFRLLPRACAALLVAVAAAAWVRGAAVYGENVAVIERNQVAVARWLHDGTPPGAVVATHDIGAMGFFAGRRLLDIAGLATPSLTTSPRNVERVMQIIESQGVNYVVLMPDWYPPLYRAIADPVASQLAVTPLPSEALLGHKTAFAIFVIHTR